MSSDRMEPLASPAGPDAASGTLPDKAPAATQPENAPPQPGSAVPASSGDPSELEGAGSQQQGLKDRKKVGLSWTEAEHRSFLQGLEKLGKGDWRGISRQFVTSRTPTQVASHAQKYYIRQANRNRRKRRASLFDLANPEQARSSPPASQVTTTMAASEGDQLLSRAESSLPQPTAEGSQSFAPSHSEMLSSLQSRLAQPADSTSLATRNIACSQASASVCRSGAQPVKPDSDLMSHAEAAFAPSLLGPATVTPPSALDAYSLGQYAAHHQAAAAAAYATAMQQQAAAAYAQALMHQQASQQQQQGLLHRSSSPRQGQHHQQQQQQQQQQHNSSAAHIPPLPSSAFRPFDSFKGTDRLLSTSTSGRPGPLSGAPPIARQQRDTPAGDSGSTCHWGHFMSFEPEQRPLAEHKGFGMLGFSPSWSAQRQPAISYNPAASYNPVDSQCNSQAPWSRGYNSAPEHSFALAFSRPSDQAASFANGKLHRPKAARPSLHGLTPPPMFMADMPSQYSAGSSLTRSAQPPAS